MPVLIPFDGLHGFAQRAQLFHERVADHAVDPDGHIPGDDTTLIYNLAGAIDHLPVFEAGRALTPHRPEKTQHVKLGAADPATFAFHFVRFIDFAGGVVLG